MHWSFRLLRVAGIEVRVHFTFFLILLLAAVQFGAPHGAPGAAFGVLLMLLLFACVTLHELGHALVARRFGIGVKQIVLLPIGGVALFDRNPEKPLHELLIAAAGPLVNVVIALGLAVVLFGTAFGGKLHPLDTRGQVVTEESAAVAPAGAPQPPAAPAAGSTRVPAPSTGTLLLWLLQANVGLVLFNLIPAFPMDGGRMFRALLACFVPHARATRIAAGLGQILAVGLAVIGVVNGQFVLALVAAFIFFGAGAEVGQSRAGAILRTLRVGDAYNKHALTLSPSDTVAQVVDYVLTSYQPDFAVVHGGRLLGVVTRDDLLRTLATELEDVYVAGIMAREVVRVPPDVSLDEVQRVLAEAGARVAAVFAGEEYLGLVSRDDIAEALLVAAYLRQRDAARLRAREASA
jgi:Zn-dependent protease